MKLKIAVFYGGISPEHEVSVITGLQLLGNIDHQKYQVIPVYVDKKGVMWSGKNAADKEYFKTADLFQPSDLELFDLTNHHAQNELDAALLCFHGGMGENGSIQGMLSQLGIPYQGPDVLCSAIAFDKVMTRFILEANEYPQTKYLWITSQDYSQDPNNFVTKVTQELGLPVYVKPANGGSTIGIQRVTTSQDLNEAIQKSFQFDQKVLVESEVTDCIEVNVSVLGDKKTAQASVPEQPLKQDELLSFADKYERGGGKKTGMASANRRIPAPISDALSTKLQDMALELFKLFGCTGVVRIDFFVNPSTEQIWVTEINTIPGSMSYYLWQASGLPYPQLIDRLIEIALSTFKDKADLVTTFETSILKTN